MYFSLLWLPVAEPTVATARSPQRHSQNVALTKHECFIYASVWRGGAWSGRIILPEFFSAHKNAFKEAISARRRVAPARALHQWALEAEWRAEIVLLTSPDRAGSATESGRESRPYVSREDR